MSRDNGIILYDYLQVKGGAENVSIALARQFDSPLCIGYKSKNFKKLKKTKVLNLRSRTPITALTVLNTLHKFKHRTHFIKDHQWAIYSGFFAPSAVMRNPAQHNIYYCHTPPRFSYDMYDWYLSRYPRWQRPLFKQFVELTKRNYEPAIKKMDIVIANSANVAKRLQRYLNCDADVIYPPCQTQYYQWLGQEDYYLSLARLEDYKRVDLIIRAFLQMPDKKLIVASGGNASQALKKLAQNAPNIHFTGWIDEPRLKSLIGKAIATIYLPIDEDFGMSPVESMAAGKPVIGVAEGGLLETIVNGATGLLIPATPHVDDIIDAVIALTPARALQMRQDCQQQSTKFNTDRFFNAIQQVILRK